MVHLSSEAYFCIVVLLFRSFVVILVHFFIFCLCFPCAKYMLQLAYEQNKSELSSKSLQQSFLTFVILPLKPRSCLCSDTCLCSRKIHPLTHLHLFQWHYYAYFQPCTWNTHHGKQIKASAHSFSRFGFGFFQYGFMSGWFLPLRA